MCIRDRAKALRRQLPTASRQGAQKAPALKTDGQSMSQFLCEEDPSWPGLDIRIERATKYIAALPSAISGENGHGAAFAAARAAVRGFALPADAAFSLLWGEFNPRCEPPWTEAELRHKVDDAAKGSGDRGYLIRTPGNSNHRPTIHILSLIHISEPTRPY